jgi:hypothetical protein
MVEQAPAMHHIDAAPDQPIAEAERILMDLDETNVRQQVRDLCRIEMLPARQAVWRMDPLPVGEQAARTRMKLPDVDVKRPEFLSNCLSRNVSNSLPFVRCACVR